MPHQINIIICKISSVIFASICLVNISTAKSNFEFSPSLSVGTGYSSNIEKDDSANEKASFIAELSPSLKMSNKSAKYDVNLDYSLNSFAYSNKYLKDDSQVDHQLTSSLKTTLTDSLFINVDAAITQELLDKTKKNENNSQTGVNNLTQTYTYGFNPYWEKRWGGLATSNLSYKYTELIFDEENTIATTPTIASSTAATGTDSKQHNASLTITNGTDFNRINWSITANHSETDFENTTQISRTTTSNASLGYQLFDELKLQGSLGYEKYNQDIENDQNTDDDKGITSSVGFTWSPSYKNILTVNFGERFYGESYDYSFQHKGELVTLALNYNEDVTNSREQLLNNTENSGIAAQLLQDSTNQTSTDLFISKRTSLDITYPLKNANFQLSLYNEERLHSLAINNEDIYGAKISATNKFKKSSINLSLNYEDRKVNIDSQGGKDVGVDLTWNLDLGKRMTSVSSISWAKQTNTQSNIEQTTKDLILDWTLSRKLSRELSAEVSLTHQKHSSTIATDEYTENVVFLNFSQSF